MYQHSNGKASRQEHDVKDETDKDEADKGLKSQHVSFPDGSTRPWTSVTGEEGEYTTGEKKKQKQQNSKTSKVSALTYDQSPPQQRHNQDRKRLHGVGRFVLYRSIATNSPTVEEACRACRGYQDREKLSWPMHK
jgi:hypothetical protein